MSVQHEHGGPYLIQVEDAEIDDEFTAPDWATRITALGSAVMDPQNDNNISIQMAL